MASFHHHLRSGLPGTALRHARYNLRMGQHFIRGDLIYSEWANMTWWAHDDPLAFWKAADENERINGAAFREHVIALPNELTREQQIQVARELARRLVGNKPYLLVVHAPILAIGGLPNVHVHLMFSDRVPDDVERTPGFEFRRFNRYDPSRGGWQKDSGGKTRMETRDQVISWRRTIADTINEALEAGGHAERVDYRSLEQQGLSREPERHLGAWRVETMTSQGMADYVQKWRSHLGT